MNKSENKKRELNEEMATAAIIISATVATVNALLFGMGKPIIVSIMNGSWIVTVHNMIVKIYWLYDNPIVHQSHSKTMNEWKTSMFFMWLNFAILWSEHVFWGNCKAWKLGQIHGVHDAHCLRTKHHKTQPWIKSIFMYTHVLKLVNWMKLKCFRTEISNTLKSRRHWVQK